MVNQKDEIQLERYIMLKVARTGIRLQHSINADRELNEKLPELDKQYNQLVQQGELPDEATAKKVLDKVYNNKDV